MVGRGKDMIRHGRGGQRGGRAHSRLLQPAAVLLAVAILGALALVLGNDLLRREESARLAARVALVERLASWESGSASPTSLAAAAGGLPFRPGDPANADLLLRLQISASGDVNHLLALLTPEGRISASYPPGARVDVAQLGAAWPTALAGHAGLSPVITAGQPPRRVVVVPIGAGRPWAVLVAISTEQVHLAISDSIAALLGAGAGAGTVSTVDPNGVALSSTTASAVGTRVISPADLAPSPPAGTSTGTGGGGTRIWRTEEAEGEVLNITARQKGTGYYTYFRQPADSLYSDLRSRGHRRNLTLLCVALVAILSVLFIALRRALSARQTKSWLRSLFAAASDIVLVTDPATAMMFVSPAIETMLGQRVADWVGRPIADLAHPDDAERLRRLVEHPDQAHGPELDIRLRTAAGDVAWFDVAARPLPARGHPAEMIITCHAADQRKRLLDQLTYQAQHDSLTGLLNRSAFEDRLVAAATAVGDDDGRSLAVLFVDLDRFKPVNDTYGHLAGDRVLQEIGVRLRTVLGPWATGARFGGDEFGILLPGANVRAATEAAIRIIGSVGQPVRLDEETMVRVAASVGIALTDGSRSAESLLRTADQAMYQAKQVGPGRLALPAADAADAHPAASRQVWRLVGDFAVIEPTDIDLLDLGAPHLTGADPDSVVHEHPGRPADERPDRGPATSSLVAGPPRTRRRRRRPRRIRQPQGRRAVPLPGRASHRAYGALPSVISLLVLAVMIMASTVTIMAIERADQRRLDNQRIHQATLLANTTASLIACLNQPSYLIEPISALPWSLTDRAADARTLESIAGPDLSTPDVVLALVDLTGQPLAVRPVGSTVPIGPGSRIWDLARQAGLDVPISPTADSQQDVNDISVVSIVPIRRAGQDVAFLLLSRALTRASIAELSRVLGILPDRGRDAGPNGDAARPGATKASDLDDTSLPGITITLVDGGGRAVISTDHALVGRRLVDAAQLRPIQPGTSRQVVLRAEGGGGLAEVGFVPSVPQPYYLVLRQDQRTAERPSPGHPSSDLVLYALVIITVVALSWTLLRESQQTRREGARLTTLLHESHDIVVVLNAAGQVTFLTSAVEGLLGHQVAHLLGRPLLDLVHPDDRAAVQSYLDAQPSGAGHPRADSLLDIRLCTATADHRWFDLAAARRAGPLGRDLMVTCHEVGERRELQARIWWQASHDTLTGLGSRTGLADRLDQLADSHTPYTILLIDLDDFKPVNDTFGHHVGDEVLRTIAARLVALVDVAPQDVFRLGGDEFLIVLPEPTEATVHAVLDNARRAIATALDVAGQTIVIRAAIGVASCRGVGGAGPDGPDPDAVIRRADAAMYAAKRAHREPREMYPTSR